MQVAHVVIDHRNQSHRLPPGVGYSTIVTPELMPPILLTTFNPWKAHQHSNASDDLIHDMAQRKMLPESIVLMRQIPVSFHLAHVQVIAKMVEVRASAVVCCGMAEPRNQLDLELYGKRGDRQISTSLDLEQLKQGTCLTRISHSAGDYVCNHLYFELLSFIHRQTWPAHGLFIHIPPITPHNRSWLVADMALMLNRLAHVAPPVRSPWPLSA
ncbi:peptidase C15 [filamentous cyanobacterium CCP5]|nr:peptidase C15 [filamentous cyanobacterium CCP5]